LGIAVGILENVEVVRGDIASWLLIGFGTAYAVWGLRLGLRSIEHEHQHDNSLDSGKQHSHLHHHLGSHIHRHGNSRKITPWALFIIFILGPCEPLIPILMYPASQGCWVNLFWVTLVFGVATIGTMIIMVTALYYGLLKISLGYFERYSHALAGLIIALSGILITLLGT
jgi:ABC-type nickel/cobalt efflux system permease component RcnA